MSRGCRTKESRRSLSVPGEATKTPTKVVLWSRLCHGYDFLFPRLLSGRLVTTKRERQPPSHFTLCAFSSIPGLAFPRVRYCMLHFYRYVRTERKRIEEKWNFDLWIEFTHRARAFLSFYFESLRNRDFWVSGYENTCTNRPLLMISPFLLETNPGPPFSFDIRPLEDIPWFAGVAFSFFWNQCLSGQVATIGKPTTSVSDTGSWKRHEKKIRNDISSFA